MRHEDWRGRARRWMRRSMRAGRSMMAVAVRRARRGEICRHACRHVIVPAARRQRARRGRARSPRRRAVDDPHAVRARRDELGDGVRERRVGRDVEDGEGVLAVAEAARRQDDGDEVDAGVLQQRRRGGLGEEVDVRGADVADHVGVRVQDGERGDAFRVEELEGVDEGAVAAGEREREERALALGGQRGSMKRVCRIRGGGGTSRIRVLRYATWFGGILDDLTYLIQMIRCDPMPKSRIVWGYS